MPRFGYATESTSATWTPPVIQESELKTYSAPPRAAVPPDTPVSRRVTGGIRPKVGPEMSWPSKKYYIIRPPPQAAVPPGTPVPRGVTGGIRPKVGPEMSWPGAL